jgi:hypothetical protein
MQSKNLLQLLAWQQEEYEQISLYQQTILHYNNPITVSTATISTSLKSTAILHKLQNHETCY